MMWIHCKYFVVLISSLQKQISHKLFTDNCRKFVVK